MDASIIKNNASLSFIKFLFVFISLFLSQTAVAWKPTTHVYLAKESLAQVDSNNEITFFKTDYENKLKLNEVIGRFEANQTLVNILKNNRDSFYAGVLGPDAYPDLPTGQTRIHVACPDGAEKLDVAGSFCPGGTAANHQLITNDWLKHIWDNAQASGQDDVIAFAFGYLVHAAGDMYMHTFVNFFAGGPFSSFSDNGLRHTVIESYVGKRTPPLDAEEYDIVLTESVSKFIFDFLVNATADSDLHKKLLVELPLDYTLSNLYTTVSIPRHFSSLRNFLISTINKFDADVESFDAELTPLKLALDDCLNRLFDADLFNNCEVLDMAQLSLNVSTKELVKDAYILPRIVYITYIRNYAKDIYDGLLAWPQFSHDVGKILLFNAENKIDSAALGDRWEIYLNRYFIKMLGGTNISSTILIKNAELMAQLYPTEIIDLVNNLKDVGRDAFLDSIVRVFTLNELTGEQFIELLEKPELKINTLINNPSLSIGNARGIDLLGLNQLMGLMDTGSENLSETFNIDSFPPAFNTTNMIKLMLLSEQGIIDLYNSLCEQSLSCSKVLTSVPETNAMLGFIRTLDGGNEWQNHNKKMLIASECGLYQQIFMLQVGEESVGDSNCVRFVAPQIITTFNEVLAPPELTAGGEFNVLPEITMSHADANVDIYYTISEQGAATNPTNDPKNSRSRLYTQAFTLQAPFTANKTLLIRAAAFKDGAQTSEITEQAFLITASQNAPSFYPALQDYQGSVSISLNADPGATIYFTINGTTPDYTSTKYAAPITLNQGQYLVRAVAYQLGIPQSAIVSKQYNVWNIDGSDNLSEPFLTPNGSINVVDQIKLSMQSFDENADIRYTKILDNVYVEPTTASTLYTSPITLTEGNWFVAVKAFDPNGITGASTTKFININVSISAGDVDLPIIEPNGGTFNNSINIQITGETLPDNAGTPQRYYTLDGADPQAYPYISANYNRFKGLNLNNTSTLKAQALQTGFSASGIASARFNFVAADPVVTPLNGSFVGQVEISLSSLTENSKIYYTTDGSEPTKQSTLYAAPFSLFESTTLRTKAMRNGYFDSEVVTANFQIKATSLPVFIKQPESSTAFLGQNIVLSALADAFPLPTYQWYKNNVLLMGEIEPKLFLNNVQANDASNYKVVIKNVEGELESNVVTLTVNALPPTVNITQQPSNKTYQQGDTLNLQVLINNTQEGTAYQWFFEGNEIIGANTSSLTIDNIDVENAGDYWLEVSNISGLVKSDVAQVKVNLKEEPIQLTDYLFAPKIINNPESINIVDGESLNLTVVVESNPDSSYQWFYNQQSLSEQISAGLLIDRITMEDSGDYFVVVTNSEGASVSSIATVSVLDAADTTADIKENTNKKASGGGSINGLFLIVFLLASYLRRQWKVKM